MTEEPKDKRAQAQALRIQARFYRSMAMVFLLVGTLIFVALYFQKVQGQVLDTFRRPLIIFTMLIPFLPAVFLARKSDKARQKYLKLVARPDAKAETKLAAPEETKPGH